ncbi:hypothetical protein MNBD_ALPHA11-1343 [hydrothermal vent metagenome]|uniref:Uncharacterized protein n=1 Tax=hydrothermal vent metagenome TaxID=652676 RepID=A0A3B0TWA7_9ZZZZ
MNSLDRNGKDARFYNLLNINTSVILLNFCFGQLANKNGALINIVVFAKFNRF